VHRRRLLAAAAFLVIVGLGVVLATRGGSGAPDTTAKLMPADALAYVHVSTVPSRTQDARMLSLAGRFDAIRTRIPKLAAALTPSAAGLSFGKDIRPWLGDDAAVALLDGGDPLLIASVRDRGGAERTLAKLGATGAGSYRGVALRLLRPSATAAVTGHHLIAGPSAAVRDAIDREDGQATPSLADARVYRRAAASRDGGASVELFVSSAGLRAALDGRAGLAGLLGRLVAGPTLEGVDAQLRAEEGGVRVKSRVLRAPGGARAQTFEPTLARHVPADAAGFVALPGLDAVAGAVARLGGGQTLGAIADVLPQASGVELADLLAPLSDEAQIAVTSGQAAPVFTLAARTRDERGTREALARLQQPISERLAGGDPFTQLDHHGTPAFALPVTPQLEPAYGISHGTVVASTARSGLDELGDAKDPVTAAGALNEVMPEDGAKVEALGFLDSRQLLALAERTGLSALTSPAIRDDLGRIGSVGALVEESEDHPTDTTAELFLEIP